MKSVNTPPATRLISFWGTTKAMARDPKTMEAMETKTERKMAFGKDHFGFFTWYGSLVVYETMDVSPV